LCPPRNDFNIFWCSLRQSHFSGCPHTTKRFSAQNLFHFFRATDLWKIRRHWPFELLRQFLPKPIMMPPRPLSAKITTKSGVLTAYRWICAISTNFGIAHPCSSTRCCSSSKHHCHVSRPLPHQQPLCHISTSAMSVAICHVSNCHATLAAFYHVSIIEMLADLYHVSNHRAMSVVIMPHQHLHERQQPSATSAPLRC
jgi:hypothetical protein